MIKAIRAGQLVTGEQTSVWGKGIGLCCLVSLALLVCPAQAQLPGGLMGQAPSAQTATQDDVNRDRDVASLRNTITQQLKETQLNHQEVRAVLEGKNPPSYASFEELSARQIQLFTTMVALNTWLNSLDNLQKTQQAERDLENEMQSWAGFGIDAPYPLGLVDQLAAEIRSKSLELSTEQARTTLESDQIAGFRKAFEQAGPKVRKAAEALEKAREKEEPRLRWLLDSVKIEEEMAGAKLHAALAKVELNKQRASHIEREIDFLNEKLKRTFNKTELSRKDLEERMEGIASQRTKLQKQLDEVEHHNSQAQEQVRNARAKLEKELAVEGNNQIHIRQLFELRQIEADTASQQVETHKLLLVINSLESILWQERFRVYENFEKGQDLTETIKNLDVWQNRSREIKNYYTSRAILTRTQIQAQNEALKNWPEQRPGIMNEKAKRDAYQERINDLEQLNSSIEAIDFLTDRLMSEMSIKKQGQSLVERLQISLATSLRIFSSIWEYEIFSVDDTIIADGKVISDSRPVTLKKVIYGLLLLTVGIWLVGRLAKLLSRLAQQRLDVDRSLLLLFEKIGQYLAIFIVIVVALGLVRIPFTAFAFLGGALAIGVGFGGQNLINNFMSSLILLLEKPIKVGDAVEIDNILGRVTAIGGRCSTIRRFDGVDLLVPNSHLLEKTVVNRTHADKFVRYCIKVGAAYGSPTREVFRILEQVVDEHGLVLKDPSPVVLLEDFAADALLFGVYYWLEVNEKLDARVTASDLRHRIDRLFRDAGINIAFPQRDVHLDAVGPLKIQLISDQQSNSESVKAELSSVSPKPPLPG